MYIPYSDFLRLKGLMLKRRRCNFQGLEKVEKVGQRVEHGNLEWHILLFTLDRTSVERIDIQK